MRGLAVRTWDAEAATPLPSDHPQADAGQGGAEFGDLWLILRHRRGWIIGATLAMLLSVVAYGALTPALYAATAQILIDPRDKAVLTNDVNAGAVGPDGGVTQVESQARVIESSGVLLRAIRTAGLAKDSEFGASTSLFQLFSGAPGEAQEDLSVPGSADAGELRALRQLRRKLAIKRADKVFVIDVTVTAQSPQKAARIANAVTDAFLADQAEARSEAARRASVSLVARLAEQREKVKEAENKVERYKAENNLIASNGLLIGEQQLSELNNQIVTARGRTSDLRARIDQIDQLRRTGAKPDATAEAISSTVVSQLRQREAELTQKEADLRTQFGPRHPSMAAVQSQIRDVHQLVTAELDRIGRAARADFDRARASEAALSRSLDGLKSGTVTSQQASVQLRELERDLEAARTVYGAFLLRAQETREQAGIDSPNARVISRAAPPEDKSWPLMGFLLLGALGGGLGLGVGASLIGEYARPSLLSRGQLQRLTGLPAASVVLPAAAKPGAAAADHSMSDLPLGRLTRREAQRDVREKSPRAWARRPDIRSILLIGADAEAAGGRRLACLMARAAESQGERALAVDCGADAEAAPAAGLREVLRGEQPLSRVLDTDDETGVALLGPGGPAADVNSRDGRARLSRLLSQAGRDFDLVIIHGGCPADSGAAALMIGAVDETFIVAQAGRTRPGAVSETLETIEMMGGRATAALLIVPAAGPGA